MEDLGRTAVLLGAGASADAGLLLTSGLAAAIVDKANQTEHGYFKPAKPDWVRALNAVYAGMVGYRGARGDNPLSAVNIETLISAVRLLRTRDDHEVAPFVATWAPSLSNFGSSDLPTSSGKSILEAVGRSLSPGAGSDEGEITEAVAEIARAAVRPDLGRPFADAETFILSSLVELLGAHQDVSYLEPLVALARTQPGGADVITLNYDLTVETAAAQSGLTVNRGIESWRPGENLDFSPTQGVLNLMKLHGSLDWRSSTRMDGVHPQLSPRGIDVVAPGLSREGRQRDDLPWIVVGDREKLATDGPTLALNFAARSALLRTNHLAVVGYSFGDAHINAMIRDWMAASRDRTMSVLDIQWPRERYYRENIDFRSALIASYGRQQDHELQPVLQRMLPIEGTTSARLGDALHARPGLAPEPRATVVVTRSAASVRFDVTWHGPDLAKATLTIRPSEHGRRVGFMGTDISLHESLPIPPAHSGRRWVPKPSFERWAAGATITVHAAAETALPVEIEVSGASIIGAQRWVDLVGAEAIEAPAPMPDGVASDAKPTM